MKQLMPCSEIISTLKSQEPELLTKRYFIPCSKGLPTRNCGISVDDLVKKLNRAQTYYLLEDNTMSPSINKSNATCPAMKHSAWSPISPSSHRAKCLLAILSNKGALEIHHQWRDTTVRGLVLSSLWYHQCSSAWGEYPYNNDEVLRELRKRSYRIKFTAFCWGKTISDGCYEMFAATMDGTITKWEITQDLETLNITGKNIYNHHTNKEFITCITAHSVENNKCVVFFAYNGGVIKSLRMQSHEDGRVVAWENVLWNEADKMTVYAGGLHCVNVGNSELALYAMKGSTVLLFYVDLDGKMISMADPPTNFNDLFISGFAAMSAKEFLVTTNSGTLYILTNQAKKLTFTRVYDSLIRANHYSCYGISLSRNKALIVVATSLRCNYDHLIVKDVSHMIWYSQYDHKQLHLIISENSAPLYSIFDVLEAYRMDVIYKNREVPWNYSAEDIDKLEPIDLKNHLALLQISILKDTIKKQNSVEKTEKETEIKDLILSCYIFKTILSLMNEETLDEFNSKSLMLMNKWLKYLLEQYSSKYCHTTTTASTLLEQLSKVCVNQEEECSICKGEVGKVTRSDMAECKNGHLVPRCTLSLLQCTDIPYYACKRCNVIAHKDAVSKRNNCCLFCDNAFNIAEHILSDEETFCLESSPSSEPSKKIVYI